MDLEYETYIPFCNFRYNRQFRYEERNGAGHLKGRYGFFDKYGELKVVNYSADPYAGFHAEGAGVPEYPHWSCSNCIYICNRLILLCWIKITQKIMHFYKICLQCKHGYLEHYMLPIEWVFSNKNKNDKWHSMVDY